MSFSFTDLQIAQQDQDAFGEIKPTGVGSYVVDNNPHESIQTWTIATFFVVAAYAVLLFACLVINGIFGTVLFCVIKTSKRPFFRLVWQLVLANIISGVANWFTILPSTFIEKQKAEDYRETGTYAVFTWFDVLADQIIIFSISLIAVHRLCIFVWPHIAEKYFAGKDLNILIAICWILGILITSFLSAFDCNHRYDARQSKYKYVCGGISNKFTVDSIEKILMSEIVLFPVATFLCYMFILYKIIKKKGEGVQLNSNEMEIFKQAVVLFVVFAVGYPKPFSSLITAASLYLPMEELDTFLVTRIINTVELLAGTTMPVLFFLTSVEVQQGLYRLQRCNSLNFLSAKVANLKSSTPQTPASFLSISPRRTVSSA